MGYVFCVGEETVWSPSLRVGDMYVRFAREAAAVLGVRTGLTAEAADMYDIDVDRFHGFARELLGLCSGTGHQVLHGLVAGVLAPSVVILDRAGRPLRAETAAQRELLDRARQLPMPR